jgi:hypothetical protein
VFYYLQFKYQSIIKSQISKEQSFFDQKKTQDQAQKDEHLRLFRPNLENPANKQDTIDLNNQEQKRCEEMNELIDTIQLNQLDIEEKQSLVFNTAYLNNVRALIKVFDRLLPKSEFIMLPGDEIVEKKHANIKILTA